MSNATKIRNKILERKLIKEIKIILEGSYVLGSEKKYLKPKNVARRRKKLEKLKPRFDKLGREFGFWEGLEKLRKDWNLPSI